MKWLWVIKKWFVDEVVCVREEVDVCLVKKR